MGSQAQKDWIEHTCRQKLETFLRSELSDRALTLLFDVDETPLDNGNKPPYMPSDKDRYLREQSPEYNALRKEFELEVK